MEFKWTNSKSRELSEDETRNFVSFPEIVAAIADGKLLDVIVHGTRSGQEIAVVEVGGYAYGVPFVREDDGTRVLKTVFPSRKLTKIYLKGRSDGSARTVH